MTEIKGKVAVVTGGSSGIGKGIAQQLAANGAQVVIIGRNREALDRVASEIGGTAMQGDVTKLDQLVAIADRIRAEFGRLDILVNNAGIGPMAHLADMRQSDWRWLLDTNLWSVINGLEAFLPLMRESTSEGHVVNTSSVNGMSVFPGLGGYSATKYAVVGLSEALSAELEQEGGRIKVSIFLPGPVHSNIHDGVQRRSADYEAGSLMGTRLEELEAFANITVPWMDARLAADMLIEGVRNNRLYVWTHPEITAAITARQEAIAQSIKDHEAVFRQ
ncbi:SDR family oxidoreductase [Novosphingobium sp.]|uniref:SDR family oxidoreductase n=1 Tax=Novosphingobium sp. TaxID=1874826 RepID=UPI002B45E498|nr:SDR family NAD(P)-dependent oxidoreductase [Novosphingobium sp.]HKR93645.1 SDR family NAD(P)-dependent oxidoreductase [Novosphingobium sp.]